jgi:putative membrane protein
MLRDLRNGSWRWLLSPAVDWTGAPQGCDIAADSPTMNDNDDPRVYFAAERTLLAWVRTGVAVIGLGFVVARFGLFLRLIASPHAPPHGGLSAVIGSGLVVSGAVFTALAAGQFREFLKKLRPDEKPRISYGPWLSLSLAGVVAALGLSLAAYLVVTSS